MAVLAVPTNPVNGLFISSFVRELGTNKELDATLLSLVVYAPHLDFVPDDVHTIRLKSAEVWHRTEDSIVAREIAGPALDHEGVLAINQLGPVALSLVIKEVAEGGGSGSERCLNDWVNTTVTDFDTQLIHEILLFNRGIAFL